MYHIKNDKRARTSSSLIYQGLTKCLQEKPFEKITISDIQRESSVGRATFYRNFDNVTDVLYWQCDCGFHDMAMSFFENKDFQRKKDGLLLCFFNYWANHSLILEQILSINRVDIIYSCHYNNSFAISDYFNQIQPIPDIEYEYYMALRSSVFIGMLLVWIKRRKKETLDQLYLILAEQIEFIRKSHFYI